MAFPCFFRLRIAVVWFILVLTAAAQPHTPTPTPTPVIREDVLVTITGREERVADAAASVAVVTRHAIETSAAPTIDDVLRHTVGFSIFRRSSSRYANPKTQGVSFRGVGSSGASRSVVFFDGVPLNDPFGGWVQWMRVAPVSVESVEVVRGGASALYGDSGVSGAVNLLPREINGRHLFSADVFVGNQHSVSGSFFAGYKRASWTFDAAVRSFQTRGYIPIDQAVRGNADVPAGVRSNSGMATIRRALRRGSDIFVRPSYFGEVRSNGTRLQANRTHIRQLVAGGDLQLRGVAATWRAFAGTQVYDQVFSGLDATRNNETITRIQRSPSQNAGATARFSGSIRRHSIIAGLDLASVRGASDELVYTAGSPSQMTGSGGEQMRIGLFVKDIFQVTDRFTIAAGLRLDRWYNSKGYSHVRSLATNAVMTSIFADRTENSISPQLSFVYRPAESLSLYANVTRSFRSPTLNELYRGFRVGNVNTLANPQLGAERALTIEGGLRLRSSDAALRATVFTTAVADPVANITVSSTPALITRQRQNQGSTRSTGIEVEGEWRHRGFIVTGGYLLTDPVVTGFPADPSLFGRRVPQVPVHQLTLQANYGISKWQLASQIRASSSQYDDDLNVFQLEPYMQIDVFGSYAIRNELRVYLAVENVTNARYSTALTPLRSVSSPIQGRVGLRWR